MKNINVAVVEDHNDLRQGLELIIKTSPGFSCIGAYESCEAILEEITGGDVVPDVILLDIGLPGMSGIEGAAKIRGLLPEAKIIMQTVFDDDENIFRAICAGANGYLLKKSGPLEIMRGIEACMQGGVPMAPSIAKRVFQLFREFAPKPAQASQDLTPREYDVLTALVDGLVYKEIADRLCISLDTVRNHIRNIYRKLHVHSKSEAVAKALRERLI